MWRRFWRWFVAPPSSRQVGWWIVILTYTEIVLLWADEPWWLAWNTMALVIWFTRMPGAHRRKWAGATRKRGLDWEHNHCPRSNR